MRAGAIVGVNYLPSKGHLDWIHTISRPKFNTFDNLSCDALPVNLVHVHSRISAILDAPGVPSSYWSRHKVTTKLTLLTIADALSVYYIASTSGATGGGGVAGTFLPVRYGAAMRKY